MKRKFTKKPVLAARAIQVDPKVSEVITNYIQEQVAEAGELGFIDGDYFAFCHDEVFERGYLSKCIKGAQKQINEESGFEIEYEDDIIEAMYDSEQIKVSYGEVSLVVRAFKAHGRLEQIPEWYFE